MFCAVLELELEVSNLHVGVDKVVAFIRAQGTDRGECLLDVVNWVQLVVCHVTRRGGAGALAFVQFRSGYEFGIGDLSEDVVGSALEDFQDFFGIAAEVVVDILRLTDVVSGPP